MLFLLAHVGGNRRDSRRRMKGVPPGSTVKSLELCGEEYQGEVT